MFTSYTYSILVGQSPHLPAFCIGPAVSQALVLVTRASHDHAPCEAHIFGIRVLVTGASHPIQGSHFWHVGSVHWDITPCARLTFLAPRFWSLGYWGITPHARFTFLAPTVSCVHLDIVPCARHTFLAPWFWALAHCALCEAFSPCIMWPYFRAHFPATKLSLIFAHPVDNPANFRERGLAGGELVFTVQSPPINTARHRNF